MFSHGEDNEIDGSLRAFGEILRRRRSARRHRERGSARLSAPLLRRRLLRADALSWRRVQQLAVCAMVLDAIVNDRDYEFFEHELIADWRIHYARACAKMKDTAVQALRRVLERERPQDPDAAAELEAARRVAWRGLNEPRGPRCRCAIGCRRASARRWPLAGCHRGLHAATGRAGARTTGPVDASYDWHVLLVAPFGSVLKDIPLTLHEVLLFRDEAHGAAAADDAECYAADAARRASSVARRTSTCCASSTIA